MIALLTVLLSFAGAAACGFMPARNHGRIRWVALVTALAGLVAAIVCCVQYNGDGEFAAKLQADWIPSLGVQFLTGYDGISLPLLILTGLVAVCGVLFTWNLDHRANEFYAYYFAKCARLPSKKEGTPSTSLKNNYLFKIGRQSRALLCLA